MMLRLLSTAPHPRHKRRTTLASLGLNDQGSFSQLVLSLLS